MEFVIFLVLTCGEVTNSVLYNPQTYKYLQGSPAILEKTMQNTAKKSGHKTYNVNFVPVKNSVGVCT